MLILQQLTIFYQFYSVNSMIYSYSFVASLLLWNAIDNLLSVSSYATIFYGASF